MKLTIPPITRMFMRWNIRRTPYLGKITQQVESESASLKAKYIAMVPRTLPEHLGCRENTGYNVE